MTKRTDENNLVDEAVDHSRRRLTRMAWSTPVIAAITLPVHAQTSATTTAAPTTTPCPVPVLTSGDIVFSGDLTLRSTMGGSNGVLNASVTNNSTVAVSLSGSFGPVGTEAFTVNLPSQLQPGETASFSIVSVESNICSIAGIINSAPLNVLVTSLDTTCTGEVTVMQMININPDC